MSNLRLLIRTLATEHDRVLADLDSVQENFYLNTASGLALDLKGLEVDLLRKQGESDPKFRKRIAAKLRAGITGGTFDEVVEFAAYLMDTDVENIELTYDWQRFSNTVIVNVDQSIIEDALLTQSEIINNLQQIVAAAGNCIITYSGTFEVKAASEPSDPDKGLTGDSTDEGGTLSGVLGE